MIRSTHGIIDSPFTKGNYINGLPNFVEETYSLIFDAYGADRLKDYEANTLYFRDSNFNRVGATFSRTTTATRVNKQVLIESVAANVPRIDYSDGSAKLLLEPSRTNLIKYADLQAGFSQLALLINCLEDRQFALAQFPGFHQRVFDPAQRLFVQRQQRGQVALRESVCPRFQSVHRPVQA